MSNSIYAIEQAFVDINAFKPNRQFEQFDVLAPWDYLALAIAFGAKGYRVASIEELRALLSELKEIEGVPALVEVITPEEDLAPQ
jgi:indolepyruvate decarboxylase